MVPDIQVTRIPPAQLKAVWNEVRPGLETVKRRTNPSWIPEDVYSIIQQNRAWLVAAHRRGEFVGFAILSLDHDQFTGRNEPMVWIAYAKKHVERLLETVLDELCVMTKELGFSHLIMHSPRPGWQRLGPKLGFTIRDCIYAKEL